RDWGEGQVQLEIDHSILTPKLATEINKFWTGAAGTGLPPFNEPVRPGMTIKRYKIERDWGEGQVQLEIDHSILTPKLATEINKFWTGA
ncbi:hypothetical protein CQA09_28740, partial [Klebsiella pneumoniae]